MKDIYMDVWLYCFGVIAMTVLLGSLCIYSIVRVLSYDSSFIVEVAGLGFDTAKNALRGIN